MAILRLDEINGITKQIHQAHLLSQMACKLVMFIREEKNMTETEINVDRVRQVAVDGLMVLGFVLLLAVQLPL